MSYTPDMAPFCRVGVLRFTPVFHVFLRKAEAGRIKAEAGGFFYFDCVVVMYGGPEVVDR